MAPLGGVHRYPKKNLWQPNEDMKAALDADSMAKHRQHFASQSSGKKGLSHNDLKIVGRCMGSQIIT